MTDSLPSWRDTATKDTILRFVEQTCTEDSTDWVPVEERVAVFDNDGTLWCEKPVPIQLDFILRRLVEMAEEDPSLRERQPWKAAHDRDHAWLAQVLADHYAGDDTHLPELAGGILAAFADISVEQFEAQSEAFLRTARHPTLERDYLDDGPEKPVRIWNRTGRRPLLAAGNSNGDIEMLDFSQHPDRPSLRLLVLHDDEDREFAYVSGAERALDRAAASGWTVVSMKDDWSEVFAPSAPDGQPPRAP